MHNPRIVRRPHDHVRGAELAAWRSTCTGKRAVAIRAAMARCKADTTSNATPTPGAGLNRATIAGHVAAPRPQQKLSPPSAAAARSGVSRATIRLVVGTTRPSPMPATAIAIVPATRSPSARPATPAAINAYPVASVALLPRRATTSPESAPATMLPANWMAKSAPAAASDNNHRAVSQGSTGPRSVVTNPVTTKPVNSSGRPL